MAVELKLQKRVFRVQQVLGADKSQCVVESVLDVPEDQPDLDKVLRVDVKVKPFARIRTIVDKVIVEGCLEVDTVYVADTKEEDQPVHCMEHTMNFCDFIDIDGVEECMDADVHVEIEDVNWDIILPCKLRVVVVLEIKAKVYDSRPIEIVTGAELIQQPEESDGPITG